ncbi:hypothetical protein HCU64_16590 [Methylobacterium sp. C25]|uniref:hypothetical protein n=1 Tax=Methylobacterium sp. C25 TaxID=2721622 RepID=UPI001F48E3EA|nr:hypothetical protein [Methylobacterium sp. C25]MCE4225375.1 hypothetical protein [Methylobacterium sp. C25]
MRACTILAAWFVALAAPAAAQVVTGGAAHTGVPAPAVTGGVRSGTVPGGALDDRSPAAGNTVNRSNSSVPGTTPGVNIGGTSTSGPPGTGGAAGGPSLDR